MKKFLSILILFVSVGSLFTACKDEETYAEQKEKERKVIVAFVERDPIILKDREGKELLNIPKMNVISEEQFYAQDSMTNVENNEFVLFKNTGIYMQIVRKGVGSKLMPGKSAEIICQHWEWNILGDSLQTTSMTIQWQPVPTIIKASNNSGTMSGSFKQGVMASVYGNDVPSGWLVPLNYVRIGRQSEEEHDGIAKVRMIVPHTQGTSNATNAVYPCFYEITYTKTR